MSMRFCPFCGRPMAVADAAFCPYCGRSIPSQPTADEMPGAPAFPPSSVPPSYNSYTPPSYVPSPVAPPPAAYAPWPGSTPAGLNASGGTLSRPIATVGSMPAPVGAPMMIAATTTATPGGPAHVVITRAPKSKGIAVLMEILLSGAGAMYADQVGVGVGCLFVSVLAAGGATAALVGLYQSMVTSNVGDDYAHGFYSVLAATIVISVAWLIFRCIMVSRYVDAYNARLAAAVGGASAQAMGLVAAGLTKRAGRDWIVLVCIVTVLVVVLGTFVFGPLLIVDPLIIVGAVFIVRRIRHGGRA